MSDVIEGLGQGCLIMSSWPDSDDEIASEESDDEEDYSGDG